MKWVLVLVVVGLVLWFRASYPTYSWKQKLTLVVDTPEGVKTGASVVNIKIAYGSTFDLPTAGHLQTGLRGEATVVDLGDGRYLFALLTRFPGMARRVFGDQIVAEGGLDRKKYTSKDLIYEPSKTIFRTISGLRKSAPVPVGAYPMLVTFDDITDPTTVRQVDSADLSATFGEGYALREATLEITDEPVTEGVVEGVLGWLAKHDGGMLDDRQISTISAENRLANDLSRGSFIRDGSF